MFYFCHVPEKLLEGSVIVEPVNGTVGSLLDPGELKGSSETVRLKFWTVEKMSRFTNSSLSQVESQPTEDIPEVRSPPVPTIRLDGPWGSREEEHKRRRCKRR